MICAWSDAGFVLPLKQFFSEKLVSDSLVKRLKFRHFMYQRSSQNYQHDLANTIIPYAENRKKDLLECIQAHHSSEISQKTLAEIENFDVGQWYRDRFECWNSFKKTMGKFCGENDENEDFDSGVVKFIRSFNQ